MKPTLKESIGFTPPRAAVRATVSGSAIVIATGNDATGIGRTVKFQGLHYSTDPLLMYDATTGLFTFKQPGFYLVGARVNVSVAGAAGSYAQIQSSLFNASWGDHPQQSHSVPLNVTGPQQIAPVLVRSSDATTPGVQLKVNAVTSAVTLAIDDTSPVVLDGTHMWATWVAPL